MKAASTPAAENKSPFIMLTGPAEIMGRECALDRQAGPPLAVLRNTYSLMRCTCEDEIVPTVHLKILGREGAYKRHMIWGVAFPHSFLDGPYILYLCCRLETFIWNHALLFEVHMDYIGDKGTV